MGYHWAKIRVSVGIGDFWETLEESSSLALQLLKTVNAL